MHTSELDELILAFEAEKASLEASIKEALEEAEYLLADKLQKGLFRVRKTLESLQQFKDPYWREKGRLERWIGLMERRPGIPGYFNADLSDLKARLNSLMDQPAIVTPNENELTDALYDLFEGKNTGFRLHLLKEFDFFIEFRLPDAAELLITFQRKLTYPGSYDPPLNWKAMPRLGFRPDGEENMKCRRPLTGQGDVAAVKLLLAQLLYEYSYYIEYDRPAKIEFL
jgi:exonuclease VII small subunit